MGVLLLVIDVALVALVEVMTWLGLTRKFGQGNIPTYLTTSIPIMTRRTTLIPNLSTTLIATQEIFPLLLPYQYPRCSADYETYT